MLRLLLVAVVVGGVWSAEGALAAPTAAYDWRTDVVQTASGAVGATRDSGPDIRVFKAIPFAAPPIGDLRWRAPQPPAAWEGVRRSETFSPKCMQPTRDARTLFYQASEATSEDCLYLNVWTPAVSASERRPVMVFLYGGGNTAGSGSQPVYDGKGLASKGAVVVTFNYRVGPFGFLAHPELSQESASHTSGNYGLLDQVAALQWVQANIAGFGGDPANVTVYGQSAGASNLSILLASPLAHGLFERAIAESLAAFPMARPTPTLAGVEQAGLAWAGAAGAGSLAELRARPAPELLGVSGAWGPAVDGYVYPDQLDRLYASRQIADVPLLVGWNANEATPYPPFASSLAEFQDKAQRLYGDMAPQFLALYPAASDEEARQQAFGPMTDGLFAWEVYTLARAHQAVGRSATFVYYFDRVPPWYPDQHFLELDPPSAYGAYHTAEQAYFYNNLDVIPRAYTAVDRTLSDTASSYLVNFATTGDPNEGGRSGLPAWPVFDPSVGQVLHLGDSIGPGPVPRKPALDFFDAFYARSRSGP